jgi:hypothetical protein
LLAAALGNGAPTPFRRPTDPPARAATRRPRPGARARSGARPRARAPRAARPRAPCSSGSTRYFCGRKPCLSAFCAARALPSSVFGPRDLAPFLRLASARVVLTDTVALGAAPIRDMAVDLGLRFGW